MTAVSEPGERHRHGRTIRLSMLALTRTLGMSEDPSVLPQHGCGYISGTNDDRP